MHAQVPTPAALSYQVPVCLKGKNEFLGLLKQTLRFQCGLGLGSSLSIVWIFTYAVSDGVSC